MAKYLKLTKYKFLKKDTIMTNKTHTTLCIRTTDKIADTFRQVCALTEYNQNIVFKHMLRTYLSTIDNVQARQLLDDIS